jgi:NAD(P)-dependent dehydrogenase (short-subunit alcohol dehydrogenase family)
MTGVLANKVAVVTGGASGIGRAIAEHFVGQGARVVIADIDQAQGQQLADSLGSAALFRTVDVAVPAQVRELVAFAVASFGGLDVMVNNAGISGPMVMSFLDDDIEATFDQILGVNLLGTMVGTQEAARHMAQNGGGSVINVTSIGGIQAGRGVPTYRASKAAVIHFTQSAAISLGEHDVRVNAIAPGSIPTPLLLAAAQHLDDETKAKYVAMVRQIQADGRPLNREGEPEDVAHAAAYLASDLSGYVTGTVLRVDGGTAAGNTHNPLRASGGQGD